MNGFERAHNSDAWTTDRHKSCPDDFSEEELELASGLHDLFSPEREELPPLYVQTLLGDDEYAPAEPGFEHKITYRVFRELHLTRPVIFRRRHWWPSWPEVRDSFSGLSRPVAASITAFFVVMVLSVVLASPSFAAGLRIILGHTGVTEVAGYPAHVHQDQHPAQNHKATYTPPSQVLWLGLAADGYTYQGMRMLDPTGWSQGPIADLQYSLPTHSDGSGIVDIREFRVANAYQAVLQVVQSGSATEVNVGDYTGVYVDGTWVPRESQPHPGAAVGLDPTFVWQSGIRSELIVERDGIVFWIVGDQRDGTNQQELIKLAQMLTPAKHNIMQAPRLSLHIVGDSIVASFEYPEGREVYQLVPHGVALDSGTGEYVTEQP